MRFAFLLAAALGFGACADTPSVTTHTNALTGGACVPDEDTYVDRALLTRETDIDCTEQGDTTDVDHPDWCCKFPQPGCDADGCCDEDLVKPPDDEPSGPDID
jgi:hypothetical protein